MFLPKIVGINSCNTKNAIAIPKGIYLLILTFENMYFLPKIIIPNMIANIITKYSIVNKKFPINISPSFNFLIVYITDYFTYFQDTFPSKFYKLLILLLVS